MKINLLFVALMIFTASCNQSGINKPTTADSAAIAKAYNETHSGLANKETTSNSPALEFYQPHDISIYSLPVKYDSANNMVNRFKELTKPQGSAPGYVYGKKSFLIKANQIDAYMQYGIAQHHPIENFRMMFGVVYNPASKKDEVTIIVTGLDKNNKYVLFKGNTVLEHCLPCPDQCPIDNVTQKEIADTIPKL